MVSLGLLTFFSLAAWPADSALTLDVSPVASVRRLRIAVDAGHGAPGNTGNHGCYDQLEQEHTLAVAQHLAFVLSSLGAFDVMMTRSEGTHPSYRARLAAAESWKADVIISLHSDARGEAVAWAPFAQSPETLCWRNGDAPGFAVLYSDRGSTTVVNARSRLTRTIGAHLRQAGFLAYSGVDYSALYRPDEVEPSGWVDVRPLKTSVYFLRASQVPTVIIETHHALDPLEVARWSELRTFDAFALSIAHAVVDFSRGAQVPLH